MLTQNRILRLNLSLRQRTLNSGKTQKLSFRNVFRFLNELIVKFSTINTSCEIMSSWHKTRCLTSPSLPSQVHPLQREALQVPGLRKGLLPVAHSGRAPHSAYGRLSAQMPDLRSFLQPEEQSEDASLDAHRHQALQLLGLRESLSPQLWPQKTPIDAHSRSARVEMPGKPVALLRRRVSSLASIGRRNRCRKLILTQILVNKNRFENHLIVWCLAEGVSLAECPPHPRSQWRHSSHDRHSLAVNQGKCWSREFSHSSDALREWEKSSLQNFFESCARTLSGK